MNKWRRKNQSGGAVEANCSKQMDQRKKAIFHQTFFVFTREVTKVQVSVECGSLLSCWSVRLKEIGQILRGYSRDAVEETVEAGTEGCSGDGTEADL